MGFIGFPEKTNDFNILSSFDLLDDWSANNAGRFLNADTRNAGTSNGQSGINDAPRSGLWTIATGTNTNGGGAMSGNIGYVLSGFTRLSFAANFRVIALADGTNSYRIFCGFNSNYDSTTAPTTRSAGFFYDNNNVNWQAYTYNSSVGTITDTGVAAVADGSYNTFCVRCNGTTNVQFFINNSLVATNTTNLPSTNVCPSLHIQKTAGNTSRSIISDWVRFSGIGNTRSLGVSA
jgi:hypothetical protein